jgi:hypothetical protein
VKTLNRLALIAFLVLALPGMTLAAKPASKFTAEYARLNSPGWRKDFPNIGKFEVLGPSTGKAGTRGAYNCIAHTLRVYNKWVWPGATVADFDRLYGRAGYKRVRGMNFRPNSRQDKIVLYAKRGRNGQIECTHGALQVPNGTWTSKLGAGPLIRHTSPHSLDGPSYGRPIAVYIRARKVPSSPSRPSRPRSVALVND